MKKNKEHIQRMTGAKKLLVGAFIAGSFAGYQMLSSPNAEANDTSRSYRVWDGEIGCHGTGGNCLPTYVCCC